ncbi:capsular biosynthesis protein, partial [Campylobacter sp. 1569]|nr:capsular biosynthesis protein [Campylobacter sp. 1569]
CNIVFYHEKQKLYKNNHSLSFKFKNGIQIKKNCNLNDFIQLSAASCFMNTKYFNKIYFDEKLKPNFEDAKFINEYLLDNINLKSAFLPNAKYFYRKREEGNSTLNLKLRLKEFFLIVPKYGYLEILYKNFSYSFICKLILYDLYWHVIDMINSPEKTSVLNEDEKKEYLNLLDRNFSYIDNDTIMDFNLAGCWFFHKV